MGLRTECTYLQNKREGCTYCCLGSLLTVFCFAFSWKFNELQLFMSRFADFFPPRQNTEKLNSRIADKSPTKQNIGQAHGMSRVRRASPLPTVQNRPGSSPESFPDNSWSQKRRASRELSLSSRQSRLTDIREINTKSLAIFLSWTALSREKLSIDALARHGRPPLGVRAPPAA